MSEKYDFKHYEHHYNHNHSHCDLKYNEICSINDGIESAIGYDPKFNYDTFDNHFNAHNTHYNLLMRAAATE